MNLKPTASKIPTKHLLSNTNSEVSIFYCRSILDVKLALRKIFETHEESFPEKKDGSIVLKPNFNSDMCGLTGNTTDLRIIVAIISLLKERGYDNITIADGASSGFISSRIDVLSRLRIKELADKFHIKFLDLNKASWQEVDLNNDTRVRIADLCLNSDMLINLPKMKTHAEAGISICSKNLMGCVVGLDKQKIHKNLPENILKLTDRIRCSLHIVDGLIAMQGTGPSKGNPLKMDLILAGHDALAIDLTCAKLMGFRICEVPVLRLADTKGYMTTPQKKALNTANFGNIQKRFEKPAPPLLFSFINNPKHRDFFKRIRYSPLSTFFSSNSVSKLLFHLGIRQDMFLRDELCVEEIEVDQTRCSNCGICRNYCPVGIDIPSKIDWEECIKCLYCYLVCPHEAIRIEGKLGYFSYQAENYAKQIRSAIFEPNRAKSSKE